MPHFLVGKVYICREMICSRDSNEGRRQMSSHVSLYYFFHEHIFHQYDQYFIIFSIQILYLFCSIYSRLFHFRTTVKITDFLAFEFPTLLSVYKIPCIVFNIVYKKMPRYMVFPSHKSSKPKSQVCCQTT